MLSPHKIFKTSTTKKTAILQRLIPVIQEIAELTDSPFSMAIESFDILEKSANDENDFFSCLLEDTVFSSLYLTFYETLFVVIGENTKLSIPMMEKFSENAEEREQLINIQTFNHIRYIENNGACPGCISCENHHDVKDLVSYYNKRNFDFFIKLYIGMKTIQTTFEKLLYNILPKHPNMLEGITSQDILTIRQIIFNEAENNLQ